MVVVVKVVVWRPLLAPPLTVAFAGAGGGKGALRVAVIPAFARTLDPLGAVRPYGAEGPVLARGLGPAHTETAEGDGEGDGGAGSAHQPDAAALLAQPVFAIKPRFAGHFEGGATDVVRYHPVHHRRRVEPTLHRCRRGGSFGAVHGGGGYLVVVGVVVVVVVVVYKA